VRYVVAGPIEGGYQYWDLTDTEQNLTVGTLHRSIPRAEAILKSLAEGLF